LQWTFYLRQEVRFHKGFGGLKADHVVFSSQRVLDPKTGGPMHSIAEIIKEINAIDGSTARMAIDRPDVAFLIWISNRQDYNKTMAMTQEQFKKVGIELKIEVAKHGKFHDYNLKNLQPHMVLVDGVDLPHAQLWLDDASNGYSGVGRIRWLDRALVCFCTRHGSGSAR
jgi:ABC-type transport system substrate-binding protein